MIEVKADMEIGRFNGQEILQGVLDPIRIKRTEGLKERYGFFLIEYFF